MKVKIYDENDKETDFNFEIKSIILGNKEKLFLKIDKNLSEIKWNVYRAFEEKINLIFDELIIIGKDIEIYKGEKII